MEQKNQNTSVVYPIDGNAPAAMSVGSLLPEPGGSGELSLDPNLIAQPVPAGSASGEKKTDRMIRRLRRVDVLLVFLLILGLIGLIIGTSIKRARIASQVDVTAKYDTLQIPLEAFTVTAEGVSFGASSVVINGSLELQQGVVVAPTEQPTDPTAGQIYYDQTSNQLAYYNGLQFVPVGGVSSLQGLTGAVTLIAGDGIAINGTTITNTRSGGGTISSPGGTAGRLPKFTAAQSIADSLLGESGTTITVNGDLSITGALALGTALSVSNGGTGATSLTANGVIVGNGTGALTSVTAGSPGLCLQSTAGAPAFAACPGGGGGVTSLNGLTGALSIANASGAGSTITINNASTAQKGIAQFNSTNFTDDGAGTINTIQNINTAATPTFAGVNTNTINPSAALTIGATGQTLTLQGDASTAITATGGGFTTTVGFTGSPSGAVTYQFDRAATAGTYTVCTTFGNCNGAGVTLQSAYNASTSPEITLDATRGALTVRDNATPLGANLLEVQNNAGGTTYFAVTSSGISTTGTTSSTSNINTSGGALQTNSLNRVDNSGNLVNIGNLTATGAITIASTGAGNDIILNSADTIELQGSTNVTGNVVATGNATLQGGTVTIGTTTQAGSLVIHDGNGGQTATISVGNIGANTALTLPASLGATDTFCFLTLANCAGAGGGVTGSGTNNRIAKFTSTGSTVGDSTISDDGTSVTTSVDLVIQGGDLTVGTTSQIASLLLHDGNGQTTTLQAGDSSGNLTFILPTGTGNANQCLKQSGTGNQLVWQDCDGGAGGSSATLQTAYNNGNSISTTGGAGDIAFTLNGSQNFTITDAASATGFTTFSLADGANATPATQLVLVKNNDTDQVLAAGISVQSATGGITTAFDASGSNITNALAIGAHAITGTNFSVTGAGAVTAVGVNSGTGLLQGTGGLTVTGAVSINNNSNNNTNVNTGTSTGTITLGGGSATLVINSVDFDVSAGALSGITGYTQASGNFVQNGAGTFGTGSGAVSLNGSTAVAATKTFTVNSGLTSLTGDTAGDALNVSNSTSSGNVVVFKDNATAVMTIANGGGVTFLNETNSASAFVVQNATAADTLFTIDTAARSGSGGNRVKIGNSTGTDTNLTLLQLDAATADPTSNLSALNGGLFYNSTTHKVSLIENGQVKIICNTTDLGCGTGTVTLQNAYNNSAGAAPSILTTSANKALTIQTANSGGIAAGNELFGVRASNAGDTIGNSLFTVNSGGVGINISGTGNPATTADLSFGNGANRSINVIQSASGVAGKNLTIQSGAGGSGGTGVDGGSLTIQAGDAGGSTAADGGTLFIKAGAATTGGETGQVIVKSGGGERNQFFQIRKADDSVLLNLNSTNGHLYLGEDAPGQSYDITFTNVGAATRTIGADDTASGDGTNLKIQAGSSSAASANGGIITLAGGTQGSGGVAGGVLVKNNGNSTTAFQVQNASSSMVLGVDTTNRTLTVAGGVSQTADLFRLQDSTTANIFRLDFGANLESIGYFNNGYGGLGPFENLLTYSEQFDNAAWTKTNVTAPTANTIVAPDGQTTAESLADSASGGDVSQTSGTAPTNDNYTFSVWLKAPSGTQSIDLTIDGATTGTGTVKTVTATTTWQRFSVTQNTNGFTGNIKVRIYPGGQFASGTVHAWGAELGKSSLPQVYVRTTATTVAANRGIVSNGGAFISSLDASDVPLIVQAAPSQSSDLLQIQNSSGTVVSRITSTGSLATSGIDADAGLIQGTGGLTVSGNINLGTVGSGTAASTIHIADTSDGTGTQTISIGTNAKSANTLVLDAGTAATAIQIGNSATAHGIQIGTGAAVQTIVMGSTNGASVLTLQAGTGGLNLTTQGTGALAIGNNAVAQTINIGNSTGATAVTIASGTGNLTLTTQGTGTLGIGNNALAQTIAIGNGTGATAVSVSCGTGTCGFGNNAIDHSTTLGSTTGTSDTTLQAGTGGISFLSTDNVKIGTSDTTGTLLVLDTKTNSGDPTGVDGAMYYNSSMAMMRCYYDGAWHFCNDPASMSWGYNFAEDFISYTNGGSGQYEWAEAFSGTGADVINTTTTDFKRPGIVILHDGTSTSANDYATILFSDSGDSWQPFRLGGGEVIEIATNLGALSTATNEYDARFGLCNTANGDCQDGVYFEYDRNTSTNWSLVTATANSRTRIQNSNAACSAGSGSSVAVTAATWNRFKIVMNSNASKADFYINGTFVGCIQTNIPTSASTGPLMSVQKDAGSADNTMSIDYFNIRNSFTTQR